MPAYDIIIEIALVAFLALLIFIYRIRPIKILIEFFFDVLFGLLFTSGIMFFFGVTLFSTASAILFGIMIFVTFFVKRYYYTVVKGVPTNQ